MEHTRTVAVQILNDANLCNEAAKKVEHITQLAELLIRKEPELIPEFLPDMGQLQVDPSALVRKTYLAFLTQALASSATPPVVVQASTAVTALLRDTSPLVARAALAASTAVLKAALALLGAQPNSPEVKASWDAAKGVHVVASGLLSSSGTQEGTRLAAVKGVESSVLMLTADHAPQLPGASGPPPRMPQLAAMAAEGATALRTLLDVLLLNQGSDGKASKVKGPLLIAAVKAVTVVGTARPALLGRVLPGLLTLAKEGGYRSSENATVGPETPGTELSVGNALRNALCGVLRSRNPASVPWRDRLVEALGAIGASSAAELSLKFVAREDYKDARSKQHRDPAEPPQTPDAKRQRSGNLTNAPPPSLPHAAPGRYPPPSSGAAHPYPPQGPPGHPHQPRFVTVGPPDAHNAPGAPSSRHQVDPRRQVSPPPPDHRASHQHNYPGYPQQHVIRPEYPPGQPQPPQPPTIILAPPVAPPSLQPPGLDHLPFKLPAALAAPPPGAQPVMLAAAPPAQPPLTPRDELMQLHLMLPDLLAHPDPSLVPAFLDSLCNSAPAMLADLVMAIMLYSPIPPLEEVTERMERELAAEAAAAGIADAATEQGTAVTTATAAAGESAAAPPASETQQAQPPKGKEARATQGAGVTPAAVDTGSSHGLPSMAAMAALLHRPVGSSGSSRHLPPGQSALPPDLPASAAAMGLSAAAPAAPPALAAAIATGTLISPPGPLSAAGVHMLRMTAVKRVAACGPLLPLQSQAVWQALLTRLAAAGCSAGSGPVGAGQGGEEVEVDPADIKATDALQEEVLHLAVGAVMEGHGLELALSWLNALLADHILAHRKQLRQLGKLGAAVEDEAYREKEDRDRPGEKIGEGEGEEKVDLKPDVKADVDVKSDVDVEMGVDGQSDVKPDAAHSEGVQAEGTKTEADGKAECMEVDGVQQEQQKLGEQQQPAVAQPEGGSQVGSVDGAVGTGTTTPDPPKGGLDMSGTRYEAALLTLLEHLGSAEQWSSLRSLISEAPVLTCPGCIDLLTTLVSQGGDAASAALSAAREAILARPILKQDMLDLVLKAAYDADASTRSKAVRLCCNQLAVLLNGALAPWLIEAATKALHSLLEPPPHDPDDPMGEEASGDWTTQEAARYCELYSTLCVRHHELLPGLMHAFVSAPPLVRAALMASSESLAKALGHSNAQLVDLVRDPIPGSEPLVWHMLEMLMSCLLPSEAMLMACRHRAESTGDVSSLVPVVAALSKVEVLGLLPQLLQLPGINLKSLFRKLATHNGALGDPLFSPAELLVAIHALDPRKDGINLRALVAAVDVALHAPDVFPQQAVAQAIQQMEAAPVLPLLFMRSVITALKAAPKLRKFVAELLARLISRQIWLDAGQWRGFLLLVEHTGRPYFHLMIQLPAAVLERALGLGEGAQQGEPRLAQDKAVQLAAWAVSPDNKTQVVRPVAVLLEKVLHAHQAQQEAVDKAAADAAAALAAVVAGTTLGLGTAAIEAEGTEVQRAEVEGGVEPAMGLEVVGGGGAGDALVKSGMEEGEEEDDEGDAAGAGEGEEEAGVVGEEGEGIEGGDGVDGVGQGRDVDEFDLDFDALEEEEAGAGSGGEGNGGDDMHDQDSDGLEGMM